MPIVTSIPLLDARYIPVNVALFENEKDTVPKPWSGQFVDLLGENHEPRESKAGTGCFSFVVYKDGARRGNAGVEWVTSIVLDLDGITDAELYQAWRRLSTYAGAMYTSYSDRAKGRCARVIVLLARWLTPDEATVVRAEVVRILGVPVDDHAKDAARIWYRPSCPPERQPVHYIRYSEGILLDPAPILSTARAVAWATPRRVAKSAEDWRDLVMNGASEGSRNDAVARLAGHLLARGIDALVALHLILSWNATKSSPPLPEGEVVAVVNSIAGRELHHRGGRHAH